MTKSARIDLLVRKINERSGTPLKPYATLEESSTHKDYHRLDGSSIRFVGAGCYHLDSQYGAHRLVRMTDEPGETGTQDITGFQTETKLIEMLEKFLSQIKD
jgi:hypothetical protein